MCGVWEIKLAKFVAIQPKQQTAQSTFLDPRENYTTKMYKNNSTPNSSFENN